MFSTILLSLAPSLAPVPYAAPIPAVSQEEGDAEAKIAACGDDVAKLVELAVAFKEGDDRASSRLAYERVLEIDANHEAAHKALRHHFYDDQWFTSYAALSKYRRAEAKRMKDEFGLVRYNDEWVSEKELPYIRMGWVKPEGSETYVNPAKAEKAAMVAAKVEEGYQQRAEDSTWIAPADFDKWQQKMYMIGDEWVTEAEANAHHAEIGQWWKYRGEHFVAYSTCDVAASAWIAWWADKTYEDLVRIYGVEPEEKPVFACLTSLAQYNNFAAGDQNAQRQPSESTGFSSCHFSYVADVWFDISNPQAPEYVGGGVAFYDVNDPQMKPWGQYSVRHAAALSYAESIDRAWNTISQFLSGGQGGGGGVSPDQMWNEKRIPRWLVYGAAAYVERFGEDKNVAEGGDPWAIRAWAMGQIGSGGKLSPLEDIFSMTLDLNDLQGSGRLIHQGGIVTAFMMDGDCAPVTAAHREFRNKMKAGEDTKDAIAAIQKAITENREALIAFSGIEVATAEEMEAAAAEAAAAAAAATPTDAAGADGAGGDGGAGADGADGAGGGDHGAGGEG